MNTRTRAACLVAHLQPIEQLTMWIANGQLQYGRAPTPTQHEIRRLLAHTAPALRAASCGGIPDRMAPYLGQARQTLNWLLSKHDDGSLIRAPRSDEEAESMSRWLQLARDIAASSIG